MNKDNASVTALCATHSPPSRQAPQNGWSSFPDKTKDIFRMPRAVYSMYTIKPLRQLWVQDTSVINGVPLDLWDK